MNMDEQQGDPEAARVLALVGELRVVLSKLYRRIRAEGNLGDLTLSQKSVLTRLEHDGPATVTALARAEGVRPQSMGATLSALEAAGYVSSAPDPTDGRQTILSLTDARREATRASRAALEDWLFRAIRAHLSGEEQEELVAAIELLKRLADS
jgi:DNA-binding MarR family transcriptional regulator